MSRWENFLGRTAQSASLEASTNPLNSSSRMYYHDTAWSADPSQLVFSDILTSTRSSRWRQEWLFEEFAPVTFFVGDAEYEMYKYPITTKSRKLKANWTVEIEQYVEHYSIDPNQVLTMPFTLTTDEKQFVWPDWNGFDNAYDLDDGQMLLNLPKPPTFEQSVFQFEPNGDWMKVKSEYARDMEDSVMMASYVLKTLIDNE